MKSIFINSIGVKSGKSLLAWALGLIFEKEGLKVGYFKPVGVQPEVVDGVLTDHDAHLMKNVLKLKDPYHLICPVVLNHDTIFAIFRRKVGSVLKEIALSLKTTFCIALRESATSASPMMVAPEELMMAPPLMRSFPLSMGPSNKAERMGVG